MFKYDQHLKKKYNNEQFQKEREHEEWDRRILGN